MPCRGQVGSENGWMDGSVIFYMFMYVSVNRLYNLIFISLFFGLDFGHILYAVAEI